MDHYPLTGIFDLTAGDIVQIEGFAEVSANAIVKCLKKMKEDFFRLYRLGYHLETTPIASGREGGVEPAGPLAGKVIVFTGTMRHGTRDEMEREAKRLGGTVGGSVTGGTDYLVAGENVGATKIDAAKSKGVKVIGENDYRRMLKGEGG